jgi:hypothetical protein
MSYKKLIKTNKKTEYSCLICSDCEVVHRYATDVIIKCKAINKAFMDKLSAKNYTCREFSGMRDFTPMQIRELAIPKKTKNKFELKGEDAKKYEQISLIDIA